MSIWLTITTCVRHRVSKCLSSECWGSDLALLGIPRLTQDWLFSGTPALCLVGLLYQAGRGARGPLQAAIHYLLSMRCGMEFLGTLGPPCPPPALPQHGQSPYLCLSPAVKGVSWPGRVSWEMKLQGPFCSLSPQTVARPPAPDRPPGRE